MSESNSKLIKAINHYQQNLERYSTNNEESKMLHCIERLQGLPIQVCHLEETGIGRTVNSLRKINGTVGESARALVNKWKNMVAQDEGEEEDTSEKHVSSQSSDNNKEYNDCIRKDKQVKEDRQHTKDKNNDRHHSKDRHDNKHSSKEKNNDRHSSNDRNEDKTHLKDKNEDRHREKKHEPSGSSRKDHEKDSKTSDKYSSRNSEESSRKRKHESSSHLNNVENGGSHKDKVKYSHKTKRKYEEYSYNKHQSSSDNCNDDSQSDTEADKKRSHSNKHYVDMDKHESKKQAHSNRYRDSDDQSDQEVEVKRKSSDKSCDKDSKSKSYSDKHKESSSRKYEKSSSKRRDEKEMDSQSDQEVDMKKSHVDKYMENESRKHKDYEKLNESEMKKRSHSEKYKDIDSQSDGDESKKKNYADKHREHSSDSKKHKSSKHSKSEKYKKSEDVNNEKKKSDKPTNSSSSSKSKNANEASSSSEINKSSNSSKKSNCSSNKKKKKVSLDDGIDCESGASFAEALGMLVPEKTSSKTIKKVANSSPEKNHSKPSKSLEPKLLLTSIDKLEPLDINITSLLPTISTNYKPLPMMNCESKSKIYNDDEALTKLMYSKNQRTKVYSGNKTWIKMPTLFELCTRILQDNIDALEYTGGVPYAILKPVLEKATPEQLFTLEHHNPYIIEDSDELWNFHCLKEFRNKKREELETAREMYMRCLDEREAKLKALTANIKLSQDKSVPVRQTKLAYVDSVAKPPRNIAKKQFKNGIEKRPSVTPSSRLSALATAGADVVVPNHRRETSSGGSSSSSNNMNKMKKAPLMAKTLQLMKGRFGRR